MGKENRERLFRKSITKVLKTHNSCYIADTRNTRRENTLD